MRARGCNYSAERSPGAGPPLPLPLRPAPHSPPPAAPRPPPRTAWSTCGAVPGGWAVPGWWLVGWGGQGAPAGIRCCRSAELPGQGAPAAHVPRGGAPTQPSTKHPSIKSRAHLRRFFTISFCFSSGSRLGGRGRQSSWKKRSCGVLRGGVAGVGGAGVGLRRGGGGGGLVLALQARGVCCTPPCPHARGSQEHSTRGSTRGRRQAAGSRQRSRARQGAAERGREPQPEAHLYRGCPLKLQTWNPFSMAAAAGRVA